MALNSGTGESAVFEIEVDATAFEAGMNDVQKKTEQFRNKINQSYEFQANAAQKSFAKQAQATKNAKEEMARFIGLFAVGIMAAKKYFAYLESAPGPAGDKVRGLITTFERLQGATAEASARGLAPLTMGLTEMANALAESSSASNILGQGLNNLVAPAAAAAAGIWDAVNALRGLTPASVQVAIEEARRRITEAAPRPGAAEIHNIRQNQERGGWAAIAARTQTGRTAAEGEQEGTLVLPDLVIPGGAGGGGGGGGSGAKGSAFGARKAELVEWLRTVEEEARQSGQRILAERQTAEAAARDEFLRGEEEAFQKRKAIEEALGQLEMDRWERSAQDAEMAEARKQAAIEQTIAAMEMSAAALAKGGPAAQAAGKLITLALAAVSGIKAAFEIAEGMAAAARYDAWGAAGHFAAAVQYGIVAGQKAGAALGGGGGRSAPSDTRGLGGGFAAPRGSSEGGGGPINVTLVLNAAGEIVDDSALRRLGNAVREIERRGYARGAY